ncbi:MAG: 2-oxo-hepta-3-ene-1,7-dioic acid hydratase [Trueperaceae bacterium]|nr:2-oxo-hepta-3-ene-1,7-dioic acid hydratase [Trueperaceae bacterium]
MLSDQERQAAADSLIKAEETRVVIPQLSKTYPAMQVEDAYEVQRLWAKERIARGAKIVGRKIGLTSRAMQMASNWTEPDYGLILDDALYKDGAIIPAGRFIRPRLETELAFIMAQDLSGESCQIHDVMRATELVTPALEVIDYRTEVPRQIVDTIADNAAFGAIILGGRVVRPFDIDVRWVGATLSQNGTIEESGVSAAVMGHPAAGIAWLVTKLAPLGDGLKKGDIVLCGSFTRPINISSGDVIYADYGPLGSIGVRFD